MNPNKLFPIVTTRDLAATRRCYESLGFELSIEMPDFVQFRYGTDEGGPEIAFMRSNDAPFEGSGLVVSIPTEDADEAHARMSKTDAAVLDAPEDRPWGWRSFHVRDPNGVVLDFFHVQRNG